MFTVVAAISATRVSFNNSIDIWFLEDDSDVRDYQRFQERFGGDEVAIIGVFTTDVFLPECLVLIERLTMAAADAPFAQDSISLSSRGEQDPDKLKRSALTYEP